GQDFKLHQPQDKVSVKAGETLTLNCTVSGPSEPGPVKWLKGWGSGNRTILGDTGSAPRVIRAVNGSNTDFTIHIRDVQPEDVGTYYCVKFRKSLSGENEVFRRGSGTEVSVLEQLLGGTSSVGFAQGEQGWGGGFRGQSQAGGPGVGTLGHGVGTEHPAGSRARDVRHEALPLFPVSPSVDVSADQTSPIEVNKIMKFTCHVKGFYPANVAVSWLENGVKIEVEKDSRPSVFRQGLFELRSQLEVQATEEKNGSMFTCLVVHDAQPPVNQSAILWIASPDQNKGSQMYSDVNLSSSILLLWLGMLLEKGILSGLLFFLFKRTKR
ncbi:SIRBL protein, partial [Piprites chloris]|nr:SIRBL protein [Piprites chloris]